MSATISGEVYVFMFGPTVGDRVRPGNTPWWIEVEKNYTVYGGECKFGGGKSLSDVHCTYLTVLVGKVFREGMGRATNRPASEYIDLLITNLVGD